MGNKIILPCIPKVENRIDAYNLEHPDISSNNKELVSIEGQLSYLDANKIICNNLEVDFGN